MSRLLGRVRVGFAVSTGLVLLSGCTAAGPDPGRRTGPDPVVPAAKLRLVAFDNCDELLRGLRAAGRESVGPYGFPNDQVVPAMAAGGREFSTDSGTRADGATAAKPAAPPDGKAKATEHSGTNTHEAGVDEPDLVKTDGRRIVTVSAGTLKVVDVASRKVTGSLPLDAADRGAGHAANLLLTGDRALILYAGTEVAYKPIVPDEPRSYGARVIMVDLAGAPRITGRYTFDGRLVDARQVGSVARVVVRSTPHLPFKVDGGGEPQQLLNDNRKIVESAPLEDWLPRYELDADGRKTTGSVDCRAVSRPPDYSGAAMLTVLTFDLAGRTLGNGDPATVVADGETVYANGTSMYVANDQRWRAFPTPMLRVPGQVPPPVKVDERTDLYKFDIAGAGKPKFMAAGAVPGWLINQYALSEWDGHLRVATTKGQPWDNNEKSESSVYVLRQRGGALEETGRVGGLGKGERIYAVRFIGPTGYVVTFRQTDPLYTVDLRDPAKPQVTGELKINGYSAYLHPAGDGRLIGIGQDANDQGRVQGTQVSLFDVSDPARPSRIATHQVRQAHSEAEFDPHAFLYWPATGLLVVPLSRPGDAGGVLALRVADRSITDAGPIDHGRGAIRRSLVIGDALWTVSDNRLAAHSLSNLNRIADVPLT